MAEGNKRQAAIIFVIAGVFLVGVFLVGLGLVKQQNKNGAAQPKDQPPKTAQQEDKNKSQATTSQKQQDKPAAKPPEQKQTEKPAEKPPTNQPHASSPVAVAPTPQSVSNTGPPGALPATGSSFDFTIGAVLFTLAGFALLRFWQSKTALLPKL